MKRRIITLNGRKFTLGARYRDKLLGNEGIAIAGASFLTGCDQIQLTFNDATGRPCEEFIDVTRLESVNVKPRVGGPPLNLPKLLKAAKSDVGPRRKYRAKT